MNKIAPGLGKDWTCEICGFNMLIWDDTVYGYCNCVLCDTPYKVSKERNPDYIPGGLSDEDRYTNVEIHLAIPRWAALTFKELWEGEGRFRYSELSEMELLEEGIVCKHITLAGALLLAGQPLAEASSSLLASGVAMADLEEDGRYWDYFEDLEEALNSYNETTKIVNELKEFYDNE